MCELYKFGVAVATAVCALLQGPEVLMMDIAGFIKNIDLGENGIIPTEPMKVEVDLLNAPYVFIAMLS